METAYEIESWKNSLFRAEEQTQGTHPCWFSEFDKYGDTQECWFTPSPTTCRICLMVQQNEHLSYLRSDIEEIKTLLKEGRRF